MVLVGGVLSGCGRGVQRAGRGDGVSSSIGAPGFAEEGASAGDQSLLRLRVAQEKGWSAPSGPGQASLKAASSNATDAPNEPAAQAQQAAAGVEETPEAKVPPKQRRKATKPGEGAAK